MKTSDFLGLMLIGLFVVTGCVSTTTGSVTEPKRDDKEAAKLNYQLGARYYQQGSYELARDRLLQATEIDPKMAIAFSTLALTYEALENRRLAGEAYENALRAAPRNFDVQNYYAVFLCRQKDYERARKMFDRAIAHPENDNSQITMTNAGVCMMQKPDPVAAEAYFRAALERKANFPEALLQMCLLKHGQEDYLGARAFLGRYLAISPPTPQILFFASRIEGQLDNARGKKEFEDQLIRTFPGSEETRMVLGAD